jgi:hypothetical protein
LRVFENRMLRKIAECKLHDVRRGCVKLCNEDVHDLYFWTNNITAIKLIGTLN